MAPFFFPNPKKAIAPPLVKWDKVSVGYAENKPVLKNITLRLDPDAHRARALESTAELDWSAGHAIAAE